MDLNQYRLAYDYRAETSEVSEPINAYNHAGCGGACSCSLHSHSGSSIEYSLSSALYSSLGADLPDSIASSDGTQALYDPQDALLETTTDNVLIARERAALGLEPLDGPALTNNDNILTWNDSEIGEGITLTYTFEVENAPLISDSVIFGNFGENIGPFRTMTTDEQAIMKQAMDLWSSVANIEFVELENPNVDDVSIVNDPDPVGRSLAGFPVIDIETPETHPDIIYSSFSNLDVGVGGFVTFAYEADLLNDYDPSRNEYTNLEGGELRVATSTLNMNWDFTGLESNGLYVGLHELGHVLGMKHTIQPGEGEFSDFVGENSDLFLEGNFSVMNPSVGSGNIDDIILFATTPMIGDILAVQFLYGQNTSDQSDTVYAYDGVATNEFAEGFGAADGSTIWDGGGVDTIDSTAYAGDEDGDKSVLLDLREGAEFYSHIGDQVIFITPSFETTLDDGSVRSGIGANIEHAIAGEGDDYLFGNHLDNTLTAGAGDDVMDGGAGADRLEGGDGIDTASYLTSDKAVDVDLYKTVQDGGDDTHFFFHTFYHFFPFFHPHHKHHLHVVEGDEVGDVLVDIENLEGSLFDDTLSGDHNDNALYGNAGNDRLSGRGGDDELYGGTGNDILDGGRGHNLIDGGEGIDLISFQSQWYGVHVNLADSTITLPWNKGSYDLVSIEGVVGSDRRDTLIGNDDSNIIEGAGGRDVITGNGGENTLSYLSSDRGVYANLKYGSFWGGDARGDYVTDLHNFYNLIGSQNRDTLIGDDKDNVLEGRGGADRLVGGRGDDTASYENAEEAVKASLLKQGTNEGADAKGDRYSSIENLTGTARYDDVLEGDNKANTLDGLGGDDELYGLKGDDTLLGKAGQDHLDGGKGRDYLDGGADDDMLIGGRGKDVLIGGEGVDVLEGGRGADVLIGGTAPDVGDQPFDPNGTWVINIVDDRLDTPFEVATGGVRITFELADGSVVSFENTFDTIKVENIDLPVEVSGITQGVANVSVTLVDIWAAASNNLDVFLQTPDGNEVTLLEDVGQSFINIGTVNPVNTTYDPVEGDTGINLTFDDVGGAVTVEDAILNTPVIGNDPVFGPVSALLDDVTVKSQSGDTLNLLSRPVTDFATYQNAKSGVIVDLENVTFDAELNADVAVGEGGEALGDRLTGIEGLIGSDHNDTLAGDQQDNILMGRDADDILSGRAGVDTIEGGDGHDVINGDEGADILRGEDGDDIIHGGADNDVINGGDGDDIMNGDEGDDLFAGGQGADLINGGLGVDTVDYSRSVINVIVDMSDGLAEQRGDAEGDMLVDVENLVGTELIASGDVLIGNASANRIEGLRGDDYIDGQDGDDVLDGGLGNDIIYGGAGNDLIDGLAISGNFDNFEDDELYGEEGDDTIFGREGRDYISGGDGNDFIDSGTQDDVVDGDAGDDLILGSSGADTIDGGADRDTIDYSLSNDAVIVDLSAVADMDGFVAVSGGDAEGDRIKNVENILGSVFDDTIIGDAADNDIKGGLGNDLLAGGDGSDAFVFDINARFDLGAFANNGDSDVITDFSLSDGDILVFVDIDTGSGFFGLLGDPAFGPTLSLVDADGDTIADDTAIQFLDNSSISLYNTDLTGSTVQDLIDNNTIVIV